MYCLSPDCHSCNPPSHDDDYNYCDEHDCYFHIEDVCEECHAQGEEDESN